MSYKTNSAESAMLGDDMVPCPHCGGDIKSTARVCPHCGSDEATGWSPDTYLDGIDIEDGVLYEEIRQNEFGNGHIAPYRRWVIFTALLVLVAIIAGLFIVLR